MPATSTDMVGKTKSAKRSPRKTRSTSKYSYTRANFPFNEGDEVVLAEDLDRYSTGAIARINSITRSYVWVNFKGETILRRCKLSHFPFEKISPRKNEGEAAPKPPDPEKEFEAFAVYDFLSKAKEPVVDILIAIETELAVPVAKQALRKLQADGLAQLTNDKEGTWQILPIASCLGASEDSVSQRSAPEESQQPNMLTSTLTRSRSINPTSQPSPSTETSETTTPPQENLTLLPVDSPAPEQAQPENGKDSSTQPPPSGEKQSESSSSASQDFSLLNSLQELSDEDLEQFLPLYIWQDTLSSLDLFEPLTWEQDTDANEFLLYPTPTSGDEGSSRAVGQTKCDRWFKTNGLIPPGSQLSASAMALMLNFPPAWFEAISPSNPTLTSPAPIAPQAESEADTLQDEALPQPKQPLSSNGYSTWTPSSGDRVKLQRKVKDYPKLAIGTVTTLSSCKSVHVRMDSDGGVYPVAIADLIFLGDKQLSLLTDDDDLIEEEENLALASLVECPACGESMSSYTDGCGVCGWQGTPVIVKDYTNPDQKGIVLKDLGDRFEVAFDGGEVGAYSKLHVYPSLESDERSSSYPLEKSETQFKVRDRVLINAEGREGIVRRVLEGKIEPYYQVESGGETWEYYACDLSLIKSAGRKPASGTLYSYIANRKNKKGINKEYQYWAYSYDVKVEGKWKSKKKSVPKWAQQRVKDAIAQKRPVSYILEILGGKR